VLSDLAQEAVKLRAVANDWVIVTHPKKELLPAELFGALPNSKVGLEVCLLKDGDNVDC
jgi:hypothetical protein